MGECTQFAQSLRHILRHLCVCSQNGSQWVISRSRLHALESDPASRPASATAAATAHRGEVLCVSRRQVLRLDADDPAGGVQPGDDGLGSGRRRAGAAAAAARLGVGRLPGDADQQVAVAAVLRRIHAGRLRRLDLLQN